VAAGMHVIIAGGNDDAKYVNEVSVKRFVINTQTNFRLQCHGEIKGPLERVSQQGQITAAYTWFSDEYGGNSGPVSSGFSALSRSLTPMQCIDVEAPSTTVLTAAADCNTVSNCWVHIDPKFTDLIQCCVLQSSSSFSAPIVAGMVAALRSSSLTDTIACILTHFRSL
jgi:hypothetical protein